MSAIELEYQNAVAEKAELEKFDFVREPQSRELCWHRNARLIACSHSKSKHVERVEWNGTEYVTVSGYCVTCRIGGTSDADHLFDGSPDPLTREQWADLTGEDVA